MFLSCCMYLHIRNEALSLEFNTSFIIVSLFMRTNQEEFHINMTTTTDLCQHYILWKITSQYKYLTRLCLCYFYTEPPGWIPVWMNCQSEHPSPHCWERTVYYIPCLISGPFVKSSSSCLLPSTTLLLRAVCGPQLPLTHRGTAVVSGGYCEESEFSWWQSEVLKRKLDGQKADVRVRRCDLLFFLIPSYFQWVSTLLH